MRTTETKPAQNFRWRVRMQRNLVFLLQLARMIFYYWTTGWRIRKAYRRCQARGEMYWVDKGSMKTEKRIR